MGRPKRAEVFNTYEAGRVHIQHRCVRKYYMTGVDAMTGKDYSYRREWIRRRMELLSAVFGIDVLTYAVMTDRMGNASRARYASLHAT